VGIDGFAFVAVAHPENPGAKVVAAGMLERDLQETVEKKANMGCICLGAWLVAAPLVIGHASLTGNLVVVADLGEVAVPVGEFLLAGRFYLITSNRGSVSADSVLCRVRRLRGRLTATLPTKEIH
jgi:hypothetical protein